MTTRDDIPGRGVGFASRSHTNVEARRLADIGPGAGATVGVRRFAGLPRATSRARRAWRGSGRHRASAGARRGAVDGRQVARSQRDRRLRALFNRSVPDADGRQHGGRHPRPHAGEGRAALRPPLRRRSGPYGPRERYRRPPADRGGVKIRSEAEHSRAVWRCSPLGPRSHARALCDCRMNLSGSQMTARAHPERSGVPALAAHLRARAGPAWIGVVSPDVV